MLSPTHKKKVREAMVVYCDAAEQYEQRWIYSQQRPYTGLGVAPRMQHVNDCSSYVALIYWWAGHHVQGGNMHDPLDENYSGWGNTETAHAYLKAHHAPENKYRVGDIALFLEREFSHHHMMICKKSGTGNTSRWSSMGGAGDPSPVQLHYRSDLTGVYRHPALL